MPDAADQSTPLKRLMSGVGILSALLGLAATFGGYYAWIVAHDAQHTQLKQQLAVARLQSQQTDYRAAVQTYAGILKDNPGAQPALSEEVQATERWTENFSVIEQDGQSGAQTAGADLDQIFAILTAALAQAKPPASADLEAHLGWAHFLNQKIAEREFGALATQNLEGALTIDAKNVYANAMLGNLLLQQHEGTLAEALPHFATAVAANEARPFVRKLQIGGLLYDDTPGARAALVQAVDDMRQHHEDLSADNKGRVLAFCFDPGMNDHGELTESLTAVPPEAEQQTYAWLDTAPSDTGATYHQLVRDFIAASLMEAAGNKPQALEQFRQLQPKLAPYAGAVLDQTNAAITRLTIHP